MNLPASMFRLHGKFHNSGWDVWASTAKVAIDWCSVQRGAHGAQEGVIKADLVTQAQTLP